MRFKLTVYDEDGSISYEFNNADKLIEQIKSIARDEVEPKSEVEREYTRPLSIYDRLRNDVYATGNRWAIENFNATH